MVGARLPGLDVSRTAMLTVLCDDAGNMSPGKRQLFFERNGLRLRTPQLCFEGAARPQSTAIRLEQHSSIALVPYHGVCGIYHVDMPGE